MIVPACREHDGFVLVGVVMMVLALTILGLSLFSLSSYEAQFMNRSLDSQQALQCAMGGLERARFVLATPPDTLGMVKIGLPRDSVIWARASQVRPGMPDSSGLMTGPNDVLIEVAARYNGITRVVSRRYVLNPEVNYYKRLLTVGPGGIRIGPLAKNLYQACGTVILGGLGALPTPLPGASKDSVWISSANPGWAGCASAPNIANVSYVASNPIVPVPQVTDFMAAHLPGSPGVTTLYYNSSGYSFNGVPGEVHYYYTDDQTSSSSPYFSSWGKGGSVTLTVNGLAIWMLPRGFRAENLLTIQSGGDPNACLVIVAHNDHDDGAPPDFGAIWAFGGISATIPVIFVTDGSVKLETFNNTPFPSLVPHMSIFANQVLLIGPPTLTSSPPFPWSPIPSVAPLMVLNYGSDVMSPIIDQLMSEQALPNSVSTNPLTFRPGTWRSSQ